MTAGDRPTCLDFECLEDPQVGDEAAAGDRQVLDAEQGDGLRKDEVDERQWPEDELEVGLHEWDPVTRASAQHGVERVQVATGDERPSLVVGGEVLREEEPAIQERREHDEAGQPDGKHDDTGDAQLPPVRGPRRRCCCLGGRSCRCHRPSGAGAARLSYGRLIRRRCSASSRPARRRSTGRPCRPRG